MRAQSLRILHKTTTESTVGAIDRTATEKADPLLRHLKSGIIILFLINRTFQFIGRKM